MFTTACPESVNVLAIVGGVVGGIVAVGLALLLIWRLLTFIHDRREFAKFEKERQNAKWDTVSQDCGCCFTVFMMTSGIVMIMQKVIVLRNDMVTVLKNDNSTKIYCGCDSNDRAENDHSGKTEIVLNIIVQSDCGSESDNSSKTHYGSEIVDSA